MNYAIHICGPKIYRFEGVTFEVHSYFGPHPLAKDGTPKAHIPRAFWELWERFKQLDAAKQEQYRV